MKISVGGTEKGVLSPVLSTNQIANTILLIDISTPLLEGLEESDWIPNLKTAGQGVAVAIR